MKSEEELNSKEESAKSRLADLLDRIETNLEHIRRRHGVFNVVELLELCRDARDQELGRF